MGRNNLTSGHVGGLPCQSWPVEVGGCAGLALVVP
jgi:hypothetical protein